MACQREVYEPGDIYIVPFLKASSIFGQWFHHKTQIIAVGGAVLPDDDDRSTDSNFNTD